MGLCIVRERTSIQLTNHSFWRVGPIWSNGCKSTCRIVLNTETKIELNELNVFDANIRPNIKYSRELINAYTFLPCCEILSMHAIL